MWGGYKRSHTTVSDWRTLLFNVLSDYIYWCTTTTSREITRRPSASPHSFLQMLGYFFFRINRLDTPFKLLTSLDTETFGG